MEISQSEIILSITVHVSHVMLLTMHIGSCHLLNSISPSMLVLSTPVVLKRRDVIWAQLSHEAAACTNFFVLFNVGKMARMVLLTIEF